MCKVSNKLKLCSCKTDDPTKLKHYWVFSRFDADKEESTIGTMLMPYTPEESVHQYNQETLLGLINNPFTFDIDLKPLDKDRLQLHFTVSNDEYMDYGFEYNQGAWVIDAYSPFEWENHHSQDQLGKIVQALEEKQPKRLIKLKKIIPFPAISVLEGPEKRLHELIGGAEPTTDSERLMKQQIEEILKKGNIIDIPSSGF